MDHLGLVAGMFDELAMGDIIVFRSGGPPLWLDKSYATQITLQLLRPDESRQVVRSVLRHTALAPGT
jgi:hypothetical protein